MKEIKNINQVENILNENKTDIKDGWIFYNFWKKVDIKDNKEDCWYWTAGRDTAGYGQFYLSSHQPVRAHRIAYEMTKGPIPEGLQVQHLCNNRRCCNPNHLELGDNSKNQQYMIKCGRDNKAIGKDHGNTIITDDQAREIHRLYEVAGRPVELKWQFTEPMAQKYGITKQTVGNIIRGKTWHHIWKEFNTKR